MRSPVIAFSLFAAAAVVSASTNGLSGSPVLGPNTLSPKPGSVNLDNSELKNHVHRQDSGAEITRTGLGISKLGASSPAHQKRAPVRQHSNIAEVEARPAEHAPAPPPRPERPVTGGVVGCNDPDTGSEGSAVVENALNSGNENGGVSCSSSAQGASAGDIGQNGESGPDAKSQDAAPGSDALNQDLDGVLSQGDGSSSQSGGDAAQPPPAPTPALYGTYPGYGGTRTALQVPRGLSTLTPDKAQSTLYEMVNATTTSVTARGLHQAASSSDDGILDVVGQGAPGESIYGDAIPGSGPQGGGAHPGTPGPSDGGRVIESGNTIDSGTNTPGAGGISRSGTAAGGDGRFH